jgi:sigma-B regulation protein RsbU (phosphoserine phosphatase)
VIQVNGENPRTDALPYVRLAHAIRQSADHGKRGGDFVASRRSAGRIVFAVGDVSLKESPGFEIARLLRRRFQTLGHAISPALMLRAMSDALMEQAGLSAPSPAFAAVLVAAIDLRRGVLTYAAAGVEGGMVFDVRSSHVHLRATGPLLGIVEHPIYEDRSMPFLPGDSLIAYTDGVTEALAATKERRLGTSGIARVMRELRPAGELTIRSVWERIAQFTGRVYHDDATLAIVTTPNPRSVVFQLPQPVKTSAMMTAQAS